MLPRAALLAAQLMRAAGERQAAAYSTAVSGAAAAGVARRLALGGGLGGIGLGTYAAVGDEPKQFAFSAAMVPIRLGRDVATAVTMVAGGHQRRLTPQGAALLPSVFESAAKLPPLLLPPCACSFRLPVQPAGAGRGGAGGGEAGVPPAWRQPPARLLL